MLNTCAHEARAVSIRNEAKRNFFLIKKYVILLLNINFCGCKDSKKVYMNSFKGGYFGYNLLKKEC